MNNVTNYQLIQIVSDSTNLVDTASIVYDLPFWFWISLIELIVIILLIINKRSKSKDLSDLNPDKISKMQSNEINMNDLMNNINKSKDLYRELSRKYHPDRFINTNKHKIAEDLFQEISKNKRNFQELKIIKIKAEKELLTH